MLPGEASMEWPEGLADYTGKEWLEQRAGNFKVDAGLGEGSMHILTKDLYHTRTFCGLNLSYDDLMVCLQPVQDITCNMCLERYLYREYLKEQRNGVGARMAPPHFKLPWEGME